MKKSILITTTLIFLLSLSCEESIRTPDITEGVNVRVQFSEGKSYFDFSDLSNSEIEYSVFTENNNISTIEIGLTFIPDGINEASRIVFDSFILDEFDDGALTRSISSIEMAELLGYNSIYDFVGGEMFNFDVVVTLDDGSVYPAITIETPGKKTENTNISPNIQETATTSFTQNFSTFVGCPSQMVEGTYIGNATDPALPCSNDPFGQSGGLTKDQEVKITQIGVISWRISDVARDYYAFWVRNEPLNMFDVCNRLVSYYTKEATFDIIATGTHNPITHQIDLQWMDLNNAQIACENTYLLKQ